MVARKETEASTALQELNHNATMIEGTAERIIMEVLGGGCLVPLGILARLNGNDVSIAAEVLSQAGDRAVGLHEVIPKNDYTRYANALGKKLQERGGARLVAESLK